jgi:peptide/nickel transport system permease protein
LVPLAEQADLRLLALCIILGITGWSGLCRFIRAETLKIKHLDFVTAARAMRVSDYKIITRHIIPNLMHIVILYVVLEFSGLVLAESVLSYIGVGVDPTTMSWGNMINAARSEISREPVIWWTITAAFIPMFIFVLVLNLLSDKLREAFDPKTRAN